ncbi:MAG: DUF502 domain-containing protein [Calditerrivibrio sp.]|nr:DUF502 domain-containing protein [Calditerrivibrio sp.]MCA1980128.1 DUF502 domain-containing protein [Calditerrivibrio sp.]
MTESSGQNSQLSSFIKIRNVFLTGIFALLPLVVSYYFLDFLFNSMTGFVLPYIDTLDLKYSIGMPMFTKKMISFFLFLLIVFLAGIITKNYFGKKLIIYFERIIEKIPLVKTVYNATKQIIVTFQSTKTDTFKKVVLVEYPRKGLYSIGFVTNNRNILQDGKEYDYYSVFIVTTPNPTSGFIIIVPKSDVIVIDISVQDAFKYIMSAGVLLPENKIKSLEDKDDV